VISRRAFLGSLGGALVAAPLVAGAQQPGAKAARIGVLYPGSDNSIFRGNFDGFRQALGMPVNPTGHNSSSSTVIWCKVAGTESHRARDQAGGSMGL
jgi:hypothetical protein